MASVRHIFRWDLDKTYLRTEFDSVRALVRTARLSAEERENIPGSAALIRGMRRPRDARRHEIYFVSGSPEQLRAKIEKKFELDGIAPEGLVLKPAVSDIFRARFRAIRNQIPYKLGALLRGRAGAPIGARETLLGDDAESDAFIYSLYADLVRGHATREALREVLARSRAYDDQRRYIEHELESIVHEPAVVRVIIHLDQLTPPGAFAEYAPLVVPIYNHLETALVLVLDGTLDAPVVREVAAELLDRFGYTVERLTMSGEDILRRRRAHLAAGALERLVAALEAEARAAPAGTALEEALAKLAERAEHVRTRPEPRSTLEPPPRRDYVALFEREEARRQEARRAKKTRSGGEPAADPGPTR